MHTLDTILHSFFEYFLAGKSTTVESLNTHDQMHIFLQEVEGLLIKIDGICVRGQDSSMAVLDA